MKLITIGISLVLGTLFLLASVASAAPGGPILPALAASAAAPRAVAASGDLLAFQLVTPSSGWALVGQQLFWTDSGGSQWSNITPLNLGPGTIRAASFADATHGWVVT